MAILDGKKTSLIIQQELIETYKILKQKICLAIIQIGHNPASDVYVRNKIKFASTIGFEVKHIQLPEDISQKALLQEINKCNQDPNITGILVQLPISKHLDEKAVINAIDPNKDVDCFHPQNIGKLWSYPASEIPIAPCTPAGIIELLKRHNIELSGKQVVIVGRSNIVGKPLAALFLANNATVTIAHSKTKNLQEVTKNADILVAAIGKANFFDESYVKPNQIVIDVGINRNQDNKLCGDVNFHQVASKVAWISPVPGGVGPMTIVMLMKNLMLLAKKKSKQIA